MMEPTKTFIGETLNINQDRELELCKMLETLANQTITIKDFFVKVNDIIADFDDDNERYYIFYVTGVYTEMIRRNQIPTQRDHHANNQTYQKN